MKLWNRLLSSVLACLLALGWPFTNSLASGPDDSLAAAPPPRPLAVPGELIVAFKSNQVPVKLSAFPSSFSATGIESVSPNTYVVHFDPAEPLAPILEAYKRDARVLYAEPNAYMYAQDLPAEQPFVDNNALVSPEDADAAAAAFPNDPRFAEQYGLAKIQAPAAWRITQGQDSTVVAVIDTGIESSHPDLQGKVVHSHNFIDPLPAGVGDPNGHGTHCAGIISAQTNNGIGIAGVAPRTKLMALRVLDASGQGKSSNIAEAVHYAADNGAHIINLSLSSGLPSQAVENSIKYAADKGVVVVAAAGNNGDDYPVYPAAYEPAIAVAAIEQNSALAPYSNYSAEWVDVAAPGSRIISTWPGNMYRAVSGTSMAAPHVSGAAALLHSRGYSAVEIRRRLEIAAENLRNDPGKVKNGLVNAYKSLQVR